MVLWHLDLVNDAIAFASHLKFHPELSRPLAASNQLTQLEAFAKLRPVEASVRIGDKVAYLSPSSGIEILFGTVVGLKQAPLLLGEIREGMRLEAKDRLNPHMICLD